MGNLMKRGVLTVLGVALVLGFWTVRGWLTDTAGASSMSRIPSRVWEGGAGTVTIKVETTVPARVSATFETNVPIDSADHRYLETWQNVEPGRHTFTVDVPANVSGTAEVSTTEAAVGSKVRVAVTANGRLAGEDSYTLTEPLRPGYALGAQVALENYATGELSRD
jgi:hypothetical protein